jgi:hypothetical protein
VATAWQEHLSKLIRAYKQCCKEADLKETQFSDLLKTLNKMLSADEDEGEAVPTKLIISSPVVGVDSMAFRALCVSLSTVKYDVLKCICVWNADIGDAGMTDLVTFARSALMQTRRDGVGDRPRGCNARGNH